MKTEEADGFTGAIVKGFDGKSGVVVGVRLVGPAVVAGFVDKDVGSSAVTAAGATTAGAAAVACAGVSVIDDIGASARSGADADVGSEHSAPSLGAF